MVAENHVLPKHMQGGPHGLGDPDDKRLRKVEKEVLIPKIMRDRARTEKCTELVADFEKCCKASGLSMVVKCQPQNKKMQECQAYWYKNKEFIDECTNIYLEQRTEYRRTGLTKKDREAALSK